MRKRSGEQSWRVLVSSVFTQQAVIPTPGKVSTQLDQVGPLVSRSLLSTGKTDIHKKQTSPRKRALQDGTGGQPCQHPRSLDQQGAQPHSQLTSSQKSRSPRLSGGARSSSPEGPALHSTALVPRGHLHLQEKAELPAKCENFQRLPQN